jgi:hypothetical protein
MWYIFSVANHNIGFQSFAMWYLFSVTKHNIGIQSFDLVVHILRNNVVPYLSKK